MSASPDEKHEGAEPNKKGDSSGSSSGGSQTAKPTPKPSTAPTPKPAPTPKKSIWQWPISKSDRDAIYSSLVSYGQSIGLRHLAVDDGIIRTPENSSWANPITVISGVSHSLLEASLKSRISYLPQCVEDYGGGEIDWFIIYIGDLDGGSCKIYVMY